MSSTYISVALRREVETRAKNRCEYCLLHADDAYFAHHVDHVIAEKHGGQTNADNLALCCAECINTKAPIWLLSPQPVVWSHYSTRDANVGAPISASTAAKSCH